MLRAHLERLALVCPACRSMGREAPRLAIGEIVRAEGEDLIEGALVCPEPACQREHPILDGVVVAVTDVGSWAQHQMDGAMRRQDLSPWMESLLGDAAGKGSSFDRERHDLSTNGTAHWGDRDAEHPIPKEGSLASLVSAAFALLPERPQGLWVDAGCSFGRASFELARAGADLVVGVDLSFSMLRRAETARRSGRMSWPRRRVGLVFERCEATLDGLPRDRVAFVCADASTLPFSDASLSGALSLNVIDCVPSPLAHLMEVGRVLRPGAPALLSTPYDWSASATQPEHWFGGHSQRGPSGGASEIVLRRVLAAEAGVDTGLAIAEECEAVSWQLALNARSTMHYAVHLLRLVRT